MNIIKLESFAGDRVDNAIPMAQQLPLSSKDRVTEERFEKRVGFA